MPENEEQGAKKINFYIAIWASCNYDLQAWEPFLSSPKYFISYLQYFCRLNVHKNCVKKRHLLIAQGKVRIHSRVKCKIL